MLLFFIKDEYLNLAYLELIHTRSLDEGSSNKTRIEIEHEWETVISMIELPLSSLCFSHAFIRTTSLGMTWKRITWSVKCSPSLTQRMQIQEKDAHFSLYTSFFIEFSSLLFTHSFIQFCRKEWKTPHLDPSACLPSKSFPHLVPAVSLTLIYLSFKWMHYRQIEANCKDSTHKHFPQDCSPVEWVCYSRRPLITLKGVNFVLSVSLVSCCHITLIQVKFSPGLLKTMHFFSQMVSHQTLHYSKSNDFRFLLLSLSKL